MDRAPVIALATRALHAAMAGQDEQAAAFVQQINDTYGADGLMVALLAWCDTFTLNVTGGFTASGPVALRWRFEDTGTVQTADEVPPAARWAGRLLIARATDDQAMFNTLMASIPPDPRIVGDHVLALLDMVALNLRAPRQAGGVR